MKTIEIPVDKDNQPLITDGMKGHFIGEFSIDLPEYCPECDPDNLSFDCAICGGLGEFKRKVNVPWTTMKRIYRSMASYAAMNAVLIK